MSTLAEVSSAVTPSGPSDIGRRYFQAALYSGFGGVASRVLYGLTPIVLARYLGPKEYGVYALVMSLVGIVAGVSHLGQNTALQKFLPEYFIKNPSRGGAILANTVVLTSGVLVIVCTGFFFLSGWIASAIYHDASLTRVFEFSALLVLSMALFNLASSTVAGLQDFKSYSTALVVRSVGLLGFAWVGVSLFGLYGALAGQLLASLLGLVLLTASAMRLGRARFPGAVRPVFSRSVLGEIFSFAFPSLLAGLLVSPAYWWGNTLLARHAGFEQVGLFGVAFAISQLIMLIPQNLSAPAVSFMSEAHAKSGLDQFSQLVSTNLRLIWALTLPISVGCALFAPLIVKFLFGSAYRDAANLASMMSLVALVIAVGSVIGYAVAGSGRMWHGFWINAFWLVAFISGAMILVPAYSTKGLALAFLISYSLLALAFCGYSKIVLRVGYAPLRSLLILSFSSIAVATTVHASLTGGWLWMTSLLTIAGLIVVEWRLTLNEYERRRLVSLLSRLGWH